MTPAFRRNGILAGLALSSLCALGFAQRSSHEWALRWQAEAEVREARETELEAAQRERGAEMDAMQRRVALLESELAREHEQRQAAEASATVAAKPAAELEAAKSELERAYARIGELERPDATVAKFGKQVAIRRSSQAAVAKAQDAQDQEFDATDVWASTVTIQGADALQLDFGLQNGSVVVATKQIDSALTLGTLIEDVETPELPPQKFEGGLNQGTNYVDPVEPDQVVLKGCKFVEIEKAIAEVKKLQSEQERVTEIR